MVNNIEKRIVIASNDPMNHMELELTSAIQDAYEKAVKEGFSGTITDWIKDLSENGSNNFDEIAEAKAFEPLNPPPFVVASFVALR